MKEFGACAPARIRFLEELDPDSIRILSVFSEAVPLFDFLVIVWIFLLETVTASNFRKKVMRGRRLQSITFWSISNDFCLISYNLYFRFLKE